MMIFDSQFYRAKRRAKDPATGLRLSTFPFLKALTSEKISGKNLQVCLDLDDVWIT